MRVNFVRSLAAFATGVAIVTTTDGNGRQVGPTINAFASVLLTPPLVLWSLCNTSSSLASFARAKYFAINVLTADQRELSQRFSSTGHFRTSGRASAMSAFPQ
jgi:3-hydroxy-9,10-secoandrosta-1,3,5(10)-triene-9,17-dione monooxygenase reductase component